MTCSRHFSRFIIAYVRTRRTLCHQTKCRHAYESWMLMFNQFERNRRKMEYRKWSISTFDTIKTVKCLCAEVAIAMTRFANQTAFNSFRTKSIHHLFFINFCADSHLLRGQTKCQTRNRKWCHRFLQNIKWIKKHLMCDTPNERDPLVLFLFSRGQFNILFIRSRWIALSRSKKFPCNRMGGGGTLLYSKCISFRLSPISIIWYQIGRRKARLHADKATHAMHYKVAIARASIASTGIPIESSVYLEAVWVYFEFVVTVSCSRKLSNGLLLYDIIDMWEAIESAMIRSITTQKQTSHVHMLVFTAIDLIHTSHVDEWP